VTTFFFKSSLTQKDKLKLGLQEHAMVSIVYSLRLFIFKIILVIFLFDIDIHPGHYGLCDCS